jgi:hypothetical protein
VREAKIGKIIGIFTHVRSATRRLFVVLQLAKGLFEKRGIFESVHAPSANADQILFTPTFRMTDERIIVGLSGIDTQPIWVAPAIEPETFWFIDQDIYYM